MRSVKVVVTGPFAAGKTTFIRTISEITVLSTERAVSDSSKEVKRETTVAMDFGRITVDDDVALYLFGTPGQERFSFMWETLSKGMLGFIVLVDYSTPEGVAESQKILNYFKTLSRVPYVVAVTKFDGAVTPQLLEEIRAGLSIKSSVPIYSCDARNKEDVKEVLLGLMHKVLEVVDRREKQATSY